KIAQLLNSCSLNPNLFLVNRYCILGEVNMKYLFTRNKFGFREQEFSNWAIFEGLMIVSGLVIVMPIISKLFKFSDPLAGALAALGRLTSRAFIAFGTGPEYLYIGKRKVCKRAKEIAFDVNSEILILTLKLL